MTGASSDNGLRAGAAQAVITPPLGVLMAGWHVRAAGDNRARYVHDDLHVKALVVENRGVAWALVAADLGAVDSVATERIRLAVAERTGLTPESVLVCATHCHSAPVVCPVAAAQTSEERDRCTVGRDGMVGASPVTAVKMLGSSAFYSGQTDVAWKETFLNRAVDAAVAAWESLRPAELAVGEAEVTGLASSRRVRLADGTWGDPRREPPASAPVVARTEIDPMVRVLMLRERSGKAPLAALINYGSHPWVFCGRGISAELAGATCRKVAAAWAAPDAAPPVVLYTAGPQGDVTLIWNIDLDRVWRIRPGEERTESLERREQGFDRELDRLSQRLSDGVMAVIAGAAEWRAPAVLRLRRAEVPVPLKSGYAPPPEVTPAEWQAAAPPGHHLTEIQALQVGDVAILGLPGEPFTSIGREIRKRAPFRDVLITALANDCGQINYIAPREDYMLGGYELGVAPTGPAAADTLIAAAADLCSSLAHEGG